MVSEPISHSPLTPQHEREPILDALRGFAILGILLVNIQFMKGTEWMGSADGGPLPASETIAQFAIGWLASGKFLSSLALLFGVGAALSSRRSSAVGSPALSLLRRRYCILIAFGLAHMMLLYPGDILFIYGVTGLIFLMLLKLRLPAFVFCAAAILCSYILVSLLLAARYAATAASGAATVSLAAPEHAFHDLHAESIAAFAQGTYSDIVAVHAAHAITLQSYQFVALPWILALFMTGYVLGRSGVLDDLAGNRHLLRRGAVLGIVVGLPANIAIGYGGPLGLYTGLPQPIEHGLVVAAIFGQAIGAPVLAVGYLCALALYCLRFGPIRPLAAVGRMALSAYLLQSGLALAIIVHLRLYDRLSSTSALLLVTAIWALLLVACPLWLSRFRFGPAEWLWRSLSYGRAQPMQNDAATRQ